MSSLPRSLCVLAQPAYLAISLIASLAQAANVAPQEGAILKNNMPTLVWTAAPQGTEQIEVWIDGVRMETLSGRETRYVPFPLSFGKHRWHLNLLRNGQHEEGRETHFSIEDAPLGDMPSNAVLLRQDWAVQSSALVGMDGTQLSSPNVPTKGWAYTSVPATVLTALVRNGVYPNPYVGLNNTRIPDASDTYNQTHDLLKYSHIPGQNPWKKPYWFRTRFQVPKTYAGKKIWLNFGEINYRAEVWLNGTRIANPQDMVGMERSFRFEITHLAKLDKENTLAVAIHPVDTPGEPAPPPVTPLAAPGDNMGVTADISRCYTKWDTMGWDWQPEIHDRDMGITEDVFLSATDDVEIVDPYIASDLPLPATNRAELRIAFDVMNHAQEVRKGKLMATITDEQGSAFSLEEPFAVEAETTKRVTWTPENRPALRIQNPKLWWPACLGKPHLYTLRLELKSDSGQSDVQSLQFGIRKLESYIKASSNTRAFRINGQELYGQGGNWVIDMLLNWTASRYDREIEITKASNLNGLRIWGPTGAPPSAFYKAADREGVLIWQDFLNDFWGTFKNASGNTPNDDVFEKATTAIIKKYRNHPSLFLWCGGNEGPNPHEALITGKLLPTYDPWGSRHYLKASNADGFQGGGPYHNLSPREYLSNPKMWGFNSEIGPSGVPEWESLQKFMSLPPKEWAKNRFPLDGQWAYHDANDWAGGDTRKFSSYDTLLRHSYGAPASLDVNGVHDYIRKAQMVNFESYRAALESNNAEFRKRATGFALWKSNSSWPSITWQISDWYMQFNAGFYAVRRALEPVHAQFNVNDRTVLVLNRTNNSRNNLKLRAELFDISGRSLWTKEESMDAAAGTPMRTSWTVPVQSGLTFLKLRLLDAHDKAISDNFYWLEEKDDFKSLTAMQKTQIAAQLVSTTNGYRVSLRNTGQTPATMVRVRLLDLESRTEALPTLWSDNYVNLLPGEHVVLRATTPGDGIAGTAAIEISGNNISTSTVSIQ